MKTISISLISSIWFFLGVASPQISSAQTVTVLQTTFDCPDWNQSMGLGDAAVCGAGDGISGGGGWTSSGHPAGDEITAAANNPAGGGGKGFRHWVCDGACGGGGFNFSWWGSSASEVWIRYYIRYQSGFAWSGTRFNKQIYCKGDGTFYFGLHGGSIGGHLQNDPNNGGIKKSTISWEAMQGGATGDGKFHALEVHAKMNTTGSSSDGIFEFWLDGTKIYSDTNAHFSNSTGSTFGYCHTSNHTDAQNGGDVYIDYDDIAVSTTGYIGPIGSTPTSSLTPQNLQVQ